jgi:CheY-like chemotaxis protein
MDNTESRWVLIAEDDEDIRGLIREAIEKDVTGFNLHIVEARDGQEAITNAKSRVFHCIVTDLSMPRSTGAELLRSIQSNPLNADTPTVVVTGSETPEFIESFPHIRVMMKPFSPKALAQVVLQELKLGRLDERASIQFMNPMLRAIQDFLEKDCSIQSVIHQPMVKKRGENVGGDHHSALTITTGVGRYQFCISFDKQLTEYIRTTYCRNRTSQWASFPPETVMRQITTAIFEHAVKPLQGILGIAPRLAAFDIITQHTSPVYKELVNLSGITIVAKTDQGRALASALTRPRLKKI